MFVYRGPMIIWVVGNVLSFLTIVGVILSSQSGETLGGYTKPELITYYLIGIFFGWLIQYNPFAAVVREIKDGTIATKILLKPVSYFWERLVWEFAWHSVSIFVGLATMIVLGFIFKNFLTIPNIIASSGTILAAIILGSIIQFAFGFTLALLAFWVTEVNAINSVKWIGLGIFGGSAIPISFVPANLHNLVLILPFRYMYSFPLEIILNKIDQNGIIFGFLMQTIWIVFFLLLYKLLWNQGLKVYSSVGQ